MESPPPYYSSAPKKSKTGLIVGIIIAAVCLCCILPIGLLAGGGFYAFNKAKGMVGCALTITNLQRAINDYAGAHDGKFPNAATWETDVKPFYQKEVAKHAGQEKMFATGAENGTIGCSSDDTVVTGISFNKDLSGKKISDIKDPFDTVALFEVPTAGTNLNSAYKAQSFASSPKMFGQQRGWYICHINGDPLLVTINGQTNPVKVNVDKQG